MPLMIPEIPWSLAYGSLLLYLLVMAPLLVVYRKEIGPRRMVGVVAALLVLAPWPILAAVVGDPCASCAKATGALWYWLLCFTC